MVTFKKMLLLTIAVRFIKLCYCVLYKIDRLKLKLGICQLK